MKSLKTRVFEWIVSLNVQEKATETVLYSFKVKGFADEPEVYVRTTFEVLEFGYEAIQWLDSHTPSPFLFKKHTLTWEDLELFSKEEQQQKILDLLMKTINSRKREYRKCQFCQEKVAIEHRFNNDTCHGCSSKHFGVLY